MADADRRRGGADGGVAGAAFDCDSAAAAGAKLRECAEDRGVSGDAADEVKSVLYPGLPGHPGHSMAARQMRVFGPVLSFVLRDRAAAEVFWQGEAGDGCDQLWRVSTTAERRARWGGDAVGEGFIRLSAGCEAIEDLIEDIGQALDAVR
jgi:cystathionine beta-lyase/cystathionine gamma-synthase